MKNIINVEILPNECFANKVYVLLTLFLGNDFLPSQYSLEDIAKALRMLTEEYISLRKSGYPCIINFRGDIDLVVFKAFINKVANKERLLLTNLLNNNMVCFAPVTLEKSAFIDANGRKRFKFDIFEEEYYKKEFERKHTTNLKRGKRYVDYHRTKINHMCGEYIINIFWVWDYYNLGYSSIDIFWKYEYYHAPLFFNLDKYLNGYRSEEYQVKIWRNKTGDPQAIEPSVQIISVIPPSLGEIATVPSKLRKIWTLDGNAKYLFNENIIVERDCKFVGHSLVAYIEPINIAVVIPELSERGLLNISKINWAMSEYLFN